MSDIVNPLQNTSYTNRDFESIYPELLDVVKSLTDKWDPSISNESDPGVVLLKLNALIADKCNYNIDKNVLETFPLSVTQPQNARQLFEQLGYYMHWFQGATTQLTLSWIDTENMNPNVSYTIPRFTMFSDYDNTVVYSILNPVILPTDGSSITVDAIQGIAIQYDINGETLITSANLDSQNRLYFNYVDVAENGIFINNSGQENTTSWIRKDNLIIEDSGNTFYKFGVSQDGMSCYVEFPDDVESVFQDGINLTYIRTDGESGNVGAGVIEKFYNDFSPEGSDVVLNADNVKVVNYNSAYNGTNAESINDAYRGYKSTVGTFKTLVTLRDYINAIINTKEVSNGFVCDRRNDVQDSYKIMTTVNDVEQAVPQVAREGGTPLLNAFDLKLYLLKKATLLSTRADYETTFELIPSSETGVIKALIEEEKSLQHDYKDIEADKLCMVIDKYPIKCNITSQYSLTSAQADEIRENVKLALYKNLNSSKVNFGEEADYDTVYSIIKNADERIKNVILDRFEYESYGIFWKDGDPSTTPPTPAHFEEKALNDSSPEMESVRKDIYAKSVLAGNTQLLVPDDVFKYRLNQTIKSSHGIEEDIARITTNVTIAIDNLNPTYTLRNNESIQIYSPNLINQSTYSNYVKMDGFLRQDLANISKDADYQLGEQEYLAFYWKDTDSQYEPYQYKMYGKGNIIKPSFILERQYFNSESVTQTTSFLFDNVLHRTGDVWVADSINDQGLTISQSAEIDSIVEEHHVLAGSRSLSTRVVNQLTLNTNQYYCYWILNEEVNGYYQLFSGNYSKPPVGNDDIPSTYEYILGTGEYFFYTDANKTVLNILGAGTKLTRTATYAQPAWKCAVMDYEKIMQEGIDALQNYWVLVPESSSLNIIENQFITLGAGNIIQLTPKEVIATWSATFTSDGVVVTGVDSFNNFIIRYKTSADDTWVYVPEVVLTNITGWDGRSLLNMSVSDSSDQPVLSNQTITCYNESGSVVYTITGSGTDDANIKDVVILSSIPVDVDGGSSIPTYIEDSDGNREYLSLYTFRRAIDSQDIIYSHRGGVTFIYTAGQTSKTITFALPTGKYILPLQFGDALTNVQVTLDGTALKQMNSGTPGISSFSTPGIYYLELNLNSISQHTLVVSMSASTSSAAIALLAPYKYGMPEGMSQADFNALLTKIGQMDYDNNYNYSYVVDPDVEIKDPLDPKSFLNSNHVYNPFTICEFVLKSEDDLYIVGVGKKQ